MTEAELIVHTVAVGEKMMGKYDYDKLRWKSPPRLYVMEIGDQ